MIIGITGGIASGKTTVSNILKKLGAVIIDADVIAHQILKRGEIGYKKVKDVFGSRILNEKGDIDRSYLGEIVFNDREKLKKLEEITHPLIIGKIKQEIQNSKESNKNNKPVFLDAALLYETGLDELVDEVWVIYVDRDTQLARLKRRDNLSCTQAKKRVDTQLPLDKKKKMADVVIDNRGDFSQLIRKINVLWENF